MAEASEARRKKLPTARHRGGERQATIGAAILDHVPAGVVALDADGLVCYVNGPASAFLGRSVAECMSLSVQDLLGADIAAQVLAEGRRGSPERRLALRLPRHGAEPFHAGVSVVTPPDGAVENVSALLVFRDLDQRRFAEEDLRRWEGHAALGRIVAGLAHEIRNPLAAIQSLSEVLMSECSETDPQFEPARRIGELVSRMERLVTACVEAGSPAPASPQITSAAHIVEGALQALSPRWGRGGQAPRVQREAEGEPFVRADLAQMVQCVRVLLDNACDAAGDPSGVAVRIGASRRGERKLVVIQVEDDGAGIPSSILPRVFEPFFTTRPDRPGLGLAVAQALALRNGAVIEARSRPGETVFTLSLPGVDAVAP
jgi:signal transduction histidine kinase